MISPDLCYCFPFQQRFHALNVLYPRCVKMCYFLKNQGEQTKQLSNWITPKPPAPAKKVNALCTSQPLISPQNSTRRWRRLSCLVSFFALHIANIHASLMTVEFEHIFLVRLYLLAGFLNYYYFYYIWFLYVPVRVGG